MVTLVEVLRELPQGYEDACYKEKAIQRARGITNPHDLMLMSMLHLFNGCSLVEISAIAEKAKLGNLSDVAFMKRFAGCTDWFKWIISNLVSEGMVDYAKPEWLEGYNLQAVDASDVVEKGRSGRTYRLHFALDLFTMHSASYKITGVEVGESLTNFDFNKGDLIVADRIYSTFKGIRHCWEDGADFVMRLRRTSFTMYDADGVRIDILNRMRGLSEGEEIEIPVYAKVDGKNLTPLRVCVRMKDRDSQRKTAAKLSRKQSKKQESISEDTLEFNKYIVLVTALPATISCSQILEIYRWRWQVELYFKRLKTIMDFGELPKKKPESVFAWLNGKLMIALLIEKIIGKKSFPPGGDVEDEEYLAGDEIHVFDDDD